MTWWSPCLCPKERSKNHCLILKSYKPTRPGLALLCRTNYQGHLLQTWTSLRTRATWETRFFTLCRILLPESCAASSALKTICSQKNPVGIWFSLSLLPIFSPCKPETTYEGTSCPFLGWLVPFSTAAPELTLTLDRPWVPSGPCRTHIYWNCAADG